MSSLEEIQAYDRHGDPVGDAILDADLPRWVDSINTARPGPISVRALAQLLRDDDEAPEALRELARGYLRPAIQDRPRARSTDPETSRVAAEGVVVQRRPGGTFHRILSAYRRNADVPTLSEWPDGLTSREVEAREGIRAAHKRTSDLLRDGLLEVVLDEDGDDLVRDGSRVLTITDAGRAELRRLDARQE